MALTKTPICDFGKKAEEFKLKSTENKIISLKDIKGERGTLIMFICNHCPFVIHVNPEIVKMAKEFQSKGIQFIAISSNDVEKYPEDAPHFMRIKAKAENYTFPYLYDEDQTVAKAYDAACTPDFFLFDTELKLVYRGQLDDSRPGNGSPLTGIDLRNAMENLIHGKEISAIQKPSIGCNIKWK